MSRFLSEQALAEGLRAGRSDAFEHLYAEQHAAVYNLCARILGDRAEAEDATHDVFMAAFSKPPAATADVKLRPWLYRVATNLCLNRLRARRRTAADGELIAAVPDRVDEYQRAETAALVEASLARLNERYRTALVLKDLHGLPPSEIASVMGVSRATVDVLVHRARGAFKMAFAKLGGSVPAPANLGVVLAPLSVPAALHAMPPLAATLQAVPDVAVSSAVVSSSAGSAAAGLFAKIASALTGKVAIGAAAATVAIGGGVIAVRDAQHHRAVAPAAVAAAVAPAGQTAGGALADRPVRVLKTRWGCLEWRTHHDLREIKRWCGAHDVAAHRTEAGHHSAGASHGLVPRSATPSGVHASHGGAARSAHSSVRHAGAHGEQAATAHAGPPRDAATSRHSEAGHDSHERSSPHRSGSRSSHH